MKRGHERQQLRRGLLHGGWRDGRPDDVRGWNGDAWSVTGEDDEIRKRSADLPQVAHLVELALLPLAIDRLGNHRSPVQRDHRPVPSHLATGTGEEKREREEPR